MNNVNLIGRLTADPEVRYTQDNKAVVKATLAVDGYGDKTDFINITAFNKTAETLEKYTHKGVKIGVTGSISTGSYINKDGNKVFTFEVVVNSFDFCEKKADLPQTETPKNPNVDADGFMNVPAGIHEELPFK